MPSISQDNRNRCLSAFPAGSNGEFGFPPEKTVILDRGKGSKVWDVNGKPYLDFSMGWGSCLVGHANPHVIDKVIGKAPNGSNFACVNTQSLELAEKIIDLSPACEQVRFCASGTEATMHCIRIARASSGKSKILKFEGAYHGSNDLGVTSLFPSKSLPFPESERSCHGVAHESAQQILVAPFNDIDSTSRIIKENSHEIAAIIVEPLHRCLVPENDFLSRLRKLCDQHGIILIFDEVVTGFRLAYGGAQEYYGVIPDLIAYGKALGGGFPIGMFGGKRSLMRVTEESRMNSETYVWTASTLGGNPITSSAALATLSYLSQPGIYDKLFKLGAYLREGLRRVLYDHKLVFQILGDGPLAQFVLTDQRVTDYRSGQSSSPALTREIMLRLVSNGIFLNPMGTKLYLSTEHRQDDCDQMLNIFASTLTSFL